MEGISDDYTAGGTETVVVEFKDLEGAVMCEERNNRVYGATTESVVGEVEFDEGGFGFESIADCGEGLWNFGDEATSEDVCKVCDLVIKIVIVLVTKEIIQKQNTHQRTLRTSVFSRNFARASAAATPIVFPPK